MKKIAVAEIKWLKETFLNYGDKRISPILKLENVYDKNIYSSIVLNKEYIAPDTTLSYISFVALDAPYDFLQTGVKFKLFDSKNIIGNGEIKKIFVGGFINENEKWTIKEK